MAKRLYSEACIRDLPLGSELVIGRNEIVTPAALDLCFTRGIRVRWSDEKLPTSGASAAESALWRAVLATDGSYMVEVKNGRARVFRLAIGGPTLVGEGI